MDSSIAKPKCDRSTREQLAHYVSFYRANPEMGMGKNNPKTPQQMRALWNQLADELNSLRGPTRTADKWKDTLGVWKSQLRTRARRARMSQRFTGGGPCSKGLGEFEERALATFGLLAVDGAGLGSTGLNLAPSQELPSGASSCAIQESSPPGSYAQSPSNAPPTSPTQSSTVSSEQNPEFPSCLSILSSSPSQSDTLSVTSEPSIHGVTPLEPQTENSGVLDGGSARMSRGERSKLISTLIGNLSRRNTFEENRQQREDEQRQEHRETMQAIQGLTGSVAELIKVLKPN